MSVENGARRIHDRIVLIVSIGKDGVDARYRSAAFSGVSGAFDQLGDRRQGGRGIAPRRARLAQQDADLARSVRYACEAVQYKEHALTLGPQMFGHAGRQHRSA